MDPTVLAALQQVWLDGYGDAWARQGGVITSSWTNPGDPIGSPTRSRLALDVAKHRLIRSFQRADGLPDRNVFVGRTKYRHTAPAIRAALRIHHAPYAAWTSQRLSAAAAANHYQQAARQDVDRPRPSDEDWLTLSARTDAQGHTTYTGSYRQAVGERSTGDGAHVLFYYTPTVVVHVDEQGRPVSWDESGPLPATASYERDATAALHVTWQWVRPHIAHGLRLTLHVSGHTFTWKVVVRAGRAVFFPVRNRPRG